MLDTVGHFCQWAGLAVNVGKEKSASCNSDNSPGHQFSIQDSLGGELQPISQLDGSPYRYLGTKFLEKEGGDRYMEHGFLQDASMLYSVTVTICFDWMFKS